jgi:hypothetical protein
MSMVAVRTVGIDLLSLYDDALSFVLAGPSLPEVALAQPPSVSLMDP